MVVFGGVFFGVFYIKYHVISEEWKFDFYFTNVDAFYFFFLLRSPVVCSKMSPVTTTVNRAARMDPQSTHGWEEHTILTRWSWSSAGPTAGTNAGTKAPQSAQVGRGGDGNVCADSLWQETHSTWTELKQD